MKSRIIVYCILCLVLIAGVYYINKIKSGPTGLTKGRVRTYVGPDFSETTEVADKAVEKEIQSRPDKDLLETLSSSIETDPDQTFDDIVFKSYDYEKADKAVLITDEYGRIEANVMKEELKFQEDPFIEDHHNYDTLNEIEREEFDKDLAREMAQIESLTELKNEEGTAAED